MPNNLLEWLLFLFMLPLAVWMWVSVVMALHKEWKEWGK